LRLLGTAILRYQPARVIALGDSFHDRGAEARIDESCLASLRAYQAGRDWLWISGNHDPAISAAMGGTVADELDLRGVRLRHEPSPAGALPEIAGHLHPAAKVRMRGRALRRRCFALSPSRCVMPAMGAYAQCPRRRLPAAVRPRLFRPSPRRRKAVPHRPAPAAAGLKRTAAASSSTPLVMEMSSALHFHVQGYVRNRLRRGGACGIRTPLRNGAAPSGSSIDPKRQHIPVLLR
jgi:hypothetical protein